ncbi:MAG: hypothetical protein MRY74_12190 [Neomegalonema sp.]|nr:hypothetical protein [Neomegalonema sp.]
MRREHLGIVRALHWLTVVLVVAQFSLIGVNALIYESAPVLSEQIVLAHVATGLAIGAIVAARVIFRCVSRSPEWEERPPRWRRNQLYGVLSTAGGSFGSRVALAACGAPVVRVVGDAAKGVNARPNIGAKRLVAPISVVDAAMRQSSAARRRH